MRHTLKKHIHWIWIAAVLVGLALLISSHTSREAVQGAAGTGSTFGMINKSGTGLISRQEYEDEQSFFNGRTFESLDTNGDGFISQSELNAAGIYLEGPAPAPVPTPMPMPHAPKAKKKNPPLPDSSKTGS